MEGGRRICTREKLLLLDLLRELMMMSMAVAMEVVVPDLLWAKVQELLLHGSMCPRLTRALLARCLCHRGRMRDRERDGMTPWPWPLDCAQDEGERAGWSDAREGEGESGRNGAMRDGERERGLEGAVPEKDGVLGF